VTDRLTGETRVVATAAPGVTWSDPVWSPDGTHLALVEDVTDATIRSVPHAEETLLLAVVELATGTVQYPAGRGRRKTYAPAWSPDGARLAFPYSPHEFVFPWHWELGVVAASGGDVQCFAGEYFIQGSVCWHPDDRTVYCQGARGSTHQVLRVDTATGRVQPLTDAPGGHEEFSLSKDGRWLVCAYQSPASLKEIYLLSTDGRQRRRLTRTSKRLERFHLAETEIVRWRAPDGLELEGALVKPLGCQPGQRYPMIVDLHGGPVVGGMAWGFYPEWHWLAAQGYLVFAPDFRGGQTYGWCAPPAEAEPGYEEHDVLDVIAGADWLVHAGYADPERLGLHGISYGAGLITRIISRTHRFRAAVAIAASVASWDMHYGAFLGGNPIRAREMGGRPWEVPEMYERHNLMRELHNVRTPTLILKGENDRGVGPNVLYTWLYQLGVEVEYVVYRGEGHTISEPDHRADCWRRTLAWFDRHLRE
jgi:dipeptidyl aminopeptidase/acylaminoacyl peptidase